MSGRKPNFSRIQLYFIQGHHSKMSLEDLAAELEVKNLDALKEVVDQFKKTTLPNAYDLMITKSENGKRSVAIMTPTVSQIGDHQRSKHSPSLPNKEGIHVINENRPKTI